MSSSLVVESDFLGQGAKTYTCFNTTAGTMFASEELALAGAAALGCEGAHAMGEMFMPGASHDACDFEHGAGGHDDDDDDDSHDSHDGHGHDDHDHDDDSAAAACALLLGAAATLAAAVA